MSIIIPVRDAAGLPPMLRTLPAADEVIVVTAGPGPDAAVRAACPGALIVHQTRTGVGNALGCGFAASTGDVVVALDGDGATDPAELPHYVDALLAGADVAFGSRYRDGGRDLIGGRFRRAVNLVLTWLLNVLYGARRTDPGFGYTALWRRSIDRLSVPGPASAGPVWGDGPEIEALLAVRAAARGLAVAEVPSVAYPRLRRSSQAGRATVRHWLRALAAEFRGRAARPSRHSAGSAGSVGSDGSAGSARSGGSVGSAGSVDRPTGPMPPPRRRSLPDRRISLSDRRSATDVHSAGREAAEPIWGPPRRDPDPGHLWLADIPAPLDRPAGPGRPARPAGPVPTAPGRQAPDRQTGERRTPPAPDRPVIASVPAPRPGDLGRSTGRPRDETSPGHESAGQAAPGHAGEAGRPVEGQAPENRREVGSRRRHLEGYRQRPDLRVINGEGSGGGRSRGGRLRAVPPRETTTGGLPRPT